MKQCQKCFFENSSDSVFCQNCGTKLIVKKHKKIHRKPEIHKEFEEKTEEVRFVPKQKNYTWVKLIIVFGLVGFVLVLIMSDLSLMDSSSQKTVNITPTPTPTITPATFPIQYLSIDNPTMKWIGNELYFTGILKNSYSSDVTDVRVRLDFYWDKAQTKLFDTRYVTIIGASSNGAYSFSEQVNVYPQKTFWSTNQIISASYYKK